MVGLKENMQGVNRVTKVQGVVGGGLKAGSGQRRILGEINKNITNGPGAYPYLQGKKTVAGKKPLVPVARRPVTRTVSAQTGSKPSLPLPEGKKPKIQIIPDEIDDDDCSIIDAEDFNALMFVQHTEAMLDEIDKMEEDVYEEPLVDIDDADKDDPLSVVEYIHEIYAHYRKQEVIKCVTIGVKIRTTYLCDFAVCR